MGTWQLTRDTPGTVVEALELGYRLIDTSGDYGTQPGIGEGLRRSDVDRDQIFVVTKLPKANRREHLVENLDVFDFELGDEHMDRPGAMNQHLSALGPSLLYV